MSVVEFIGFIITMLALIFLFGKQTYEERKRRKNPEAYREEQERKQKALDEFMRGLQIEQEEVFEEEEEEIEEWEQETFSPPPPLVVIEKKSPPPKKAPKEARINAILGSLPAKNTLPVIHAIFGPPKSLENEQSRNKIFRNTHKN